MNQESPDFSAARNHDELLSMVKGEEYTLPTPPNIRMKLNGEILTSLQLPDGESVDVFSGTGEHKNNPLSTSEKGLGPLPKGDYYIVERMRGGVGGQVLTWAQDKGDWFALYRMDGKIDDITTIDGVERGLFRMHSGSRSAGCVTFTNDSDYSGVRNMLLNSTNSKIPNSNRVYYGTLTVE